MNQEYFLTSRHGGVGSTAMFHNKDEKGYGSDLRNLETYSAEKAQKYHDQYGRESLPLLAAKVLASSTKRVDHQYINFNEGMAIPGQLCVVTNPRDYDGNDIFFRAKASHQMHWTPNLDEALVYKFEELPNLGSTLMPWSLAYMTTKARPTFQLKNINTRSMCRGVKLKKKYTPSNSNKVRWNCPACGKISWQYNPYDFEGCSDINCSEWI
ncbi:hypothetical protein [Alteromonas mediterranea]|uniref:hypothetical protein n=1 Tax=Alteromonas mediterranea TaxID=314275 RepID=UPI00241F0E5F|nr:hypothetical protein [Alteromonas mediterranea]|tara:strand:+ start:555 stop:1187 length:633 start_codon:yes stop_codon:yes gene_type:complete